MLEAFAFGIGPVRLAPAVFFGSRRTVGYARALPVGATAVGERSLGRPATPM